MSAQTAMIEVKYVNPPKEGKQYGSIKGADNDSWPVKADRIREFEPNNKYEIAFVEGNNGFRNIIGVKRVVPAPEPEGAYIKNTAKPRATEYNRSTAPRDSERMFCCAIAGHWIATGRVDMTEEAMIGLVNSLRKVYGATFGTEDAAA